MDEEEIEAIRKQSMAGLFMAFSMTKKDESKNKKKKRPPLPPRDGISEDSMEDMVSDFTPGQSPGKRSPNLQYQPVGHSKNLSIDTDTILKNANLNLNDSMISDAKGVKGKNALPLPQPLAEGIQITEGYLKQFKQTQNFQVYRVICDFHPLDTKRHLKVTTGELISGFSEENGWICAFKDVSPNYFGFVPKNYLKFEHRTNS